MRTKKILKAVIALFVCLTVAVLPLVTVSGADSYKLTYEDFSGDSKFYNDNIAKAASLILYYGSCGEQVLRNAIAKVYGLGDIVYEIHTAATEIDHIISSKKIRNGTDEWYLVSVSLINSAGDQWYDNFDPGTGDIHRGFAAGEEYIEKIVEKYISDVVPEDKPLKLMISGHSRGAAIADLFAKKLIDSEKYTSKENIFTYTFASPNNSKAKDINDEKYLRIFNFVNPEDFVPRCMPAEWGYGKYGTVLTLPGKTTGSGQINGKYIEYSEYRSRMEAKFKLYSGQTFYSLDSGEEPIYKLFKTITQRIKNVEGMYTVKMDAGIGYKTMYEFFTTTVCPILSGRFEAEKDERLKDGLVNLLIAWLMPNTCAVYREFMDYMMEAEGFASAGDWLRSKNADIDSLTPDSALKLLLPEDIYTKYGKFILLISDFKLEQLIDSVKTSGHVFNSAHNISAYMAFVTTMTEAELLAPRSSNRTEIKTDKDIEIYRRDTGALVGRTVLNTVDKELMKAAGSVVIGTGNGALTVWLPNRENYEIRYVTNTADELRLRYRSSKTLKTTGDGVTYVSGDRSIARVDSQGRVTGTGKGSVLVSAVSFPASGEPVAAFTKVTVYYAWWQYLIKYLALGFLWY
ncbi:MAG: hypothetical protein K5756_04470 [Clostridiales bacterium]|nr:hypothetical protein [Clostridiales bacterium]